MFLWIGREIDLLKDIYAQLEKMYSTIVEWRRYLHMHPELSYQEVETPKFIANKLLEFGLQVRTGVGGRGVVGRVCGKYPGKTVALRADFDALPIQDEKDVPYKSTVDGVMHACGHDAHTATLLAVAKVLQDHRDQLHGDVVFIHQFAEEVAPGGAKYMIEDGCLDGVDAIFGTHLWSQLPYGTIGYKPGYFMAATDQFDIEIIGRGGHGALPHETVDAIVLASSVVSKLQQIVSRRINPLSTAVVTVGTFHAGNAFNVIAERAILSGTVRTFEPQIRDLIEQEIERIVAGEVSPFNAHYKYTYHRGIDAVKNDIEATRFFAKAVEDVFEDVQVQEIDPLMVGEDFTNYLKKIPGTFFLTGAGNPEVGAKYPHHHPKFDIDERAMLVASKALATVAFKFLEEHKDQ